VRIGLALCAAGAALAACGGQRGLSESDRATAAASGTLAFDTAAWRRAGPVDRGRMVADLDRRHRLVGATVRAVKALLGPGECFVSYEDEPCYHVELGGVRYALELRVNHSNARGRVVSVGLRK
jgi:hypothetical protein